MHLGDLLVRLIFETAGFEYLPGERGHSLERLADDPLDLPREDLARVESLQRADVGGDHLAAELVDLLFDLGMTRLGAEPVEAAVAHDGQHIGREVAVGREFLPVFPEGHETLRHDVFRYGPVAHVAVRKKLEPGPVAGEQAAEFHGSHAVMRLCRQNLVLRRNLRRDTAMHAVPDILSALLRKYTKFGLFAKFISLCSAGTRRGRIGQVEIFRYFCPFRTRVR